MWILQANNYQSFLVLKLRLYLLYSIYEEIEKKWIQKKKRAAKLTGVKFSNEKYY